MLDQENSQSVIVKDIHMPFISMVVFMVKWAIAAIPAFLILIILGFFTSGLLGEFFRYKTVVIHDESVATGQKMLVNNVHHDMNRICSF